MLGLRAPYQDDLAAPIADAASRAEVGTGIANNLTLIRKVGNRAVHDPTPIPPLPALQGLREPPPSTRRSSG